VVHLPGAGQRLVAVDETEPTQQFFHQFESLLFRDGMPERRVLPYRGTASFDPSGIQEFMPLPEGNVKEIS
jgi:hypothetical protein